MLSQAEQKKLIKKLWKEEKDFTLFFGGLWLFVIIVLWITTMELFIMGEGCFTGLFCSCAVMMPFVLVLKNFIRKAKLINKEKFEYHYVPIDKYEPDRYSYRIIYTIDGKKYTASTDVYGGKYVHVFLIGNDELIKVETEEEE